MHSRTLLAGTAVVLAVLVTAGMAGAFPPGQATQQAEQPQVDQPNVERPQTDHPETDHPETDGSAADEEAADEPPTGESAAERDTRPAAASGPPSATIEVAASGQVQAQADRGIVRVAIVSTGDDVETVRQQLADNASRMREALAEAGVEGDRLRTAYYDISSNEPYRPVPKGDRPDYSGTHAFEITVNDTSRVGTVIDTAVTNGADEVDDVEFTLSVEKRADLREQALERAMDGARGEAETVAASENLTVTGVHEITTTQYSRTPYSLEMPTAGDAGGAPTSIDSGPVTVSASVTVVYEGQPGGA